MPARQRNVRADLTISRADLVHALELVHPVVDRKSSLPILPCVLLTADDAGTLKASGTDLCVSAAVTVPATVKRGGCIAVPAHTLIHVISSLPDADVQLTVDSRHALRVRCGESDYRIHGVRGEDFPTLPSPDGTTFQSIGVGVLARLIALTQYAASTDDSRPHLAGALLEVGAGVLRMVTTDGHRLSRAEVLADVTPLGAVLVPRKGVAEVRRFLAATRAPSKGQQTAVELAVADGVLFVRSEAAVLSVKLCDASFPEYAKMFPTKHSRTAIVRREPLLEALKRLYLVAGGKSEGGIVLGLANATVELTGESVDVGAGREQLEASVAGEALQVSFHGRYLIDVLSALDTDDVQIELGGALDPGVLKPVGESPTFVGVVMPMRSAGGVA